MRQQKGTRLRYLFTNDTEALIDIQITKVLESMESFGVDSPEYSELMTKLERLHELKTRHRPEPLSRETIALVLGNLTGILLIVAYEQKHVLTSKAVNQIGRLKT